MRVESPQQDGKPRFRKVVTRVLCWLALKGAWLWVRRHFEDLL